jgi:hypothetical protein
VWAAGAALRPLDHGVQRALAPQKIHVVESIEVLPVPLSRVDDWLDSRQAEGKPIDPKIYAALYWLQKSGHHVRC